MLTTATIHLHPTVISPFLVFEIRRLALAHGCTFAPSKPMEAKSHTTTRFVPSNGGDAA